MNKDLSHRIRERAHRIWEDEGRPSGRADAHWSMASDQLAAETAKPAGRKSVAAASTAAKRVSETTAAGPKTRKSAPRT